MDRWKNPPIIKPAMICNKVWRVKHFTKYSKNGILCFSGDHLKWREIQEQGHRKQVWAQVKIFSGPPAKENQLKIFTLNQKHQLSIAGWLRLDTKGLICIIGKLWYYRGRQKHIQNRQAPVICTGFFFTSLHPHPPPPSTALSRKV